MSKNINTKIDKMIIMKSKKIRKVILKAPELRRVRDNLRIILKLTINEELTRLQKLRILYRNKNYLTPSQQKRRSQLSREWNKLYHRFNKSTLQCSNGAGCISLDKAIEEGLDPKDRPTDLDLVWVPWLERWVCTNCFETFRYDEMTHEDFDDPVTREWVKEEFGI